PTVTGIFMMQSQDTAITRFFIMDKRIILARPAGILFETDCHTVVYIAVVNIGWFCSNLYR
ncbi:MAG: hypothetical protein WD599_05060, partial [Balneolaceae bacterium]